MGKPSEPACQYTLANRHGGAFYKNDGPHAVLPKDLDQIPEPVPRWEPLHPWANRPYTAFGRRIVPQRLAGKQTQIGIGSWYGRRFHKKNTASGEAYDMFAMTAASPTLPIPSYARVTHLKNHRSVIVRINDRGPFHKGRIIDLSFLAACRLGYAQGGLAKLKVESLVPDDTPIRTIITRSTSIRQNTPRRTTTQPAPPVPPRGLAEF